MVIPNHLGTVMGLCLPGSVAMVEVLAAKSAIEFAL